ncbi:MAG: universal stress protein [Chitinispirillia bacterium]|nr:universal stress protein [Chitinispirillia bacterium]
MDEQKQRSITKSANKLKIILPIYGEANIQAPFAHALRLAQASRGSLEIVDVRSEEEALEHIGVRNLLVKWGVLLPGAHRSDVEEAGLNIKKIVRTGNKRKEILRRMAKRTHNMLVVGTEKQPAFPFSSFRNLPEKIAANFKENILYIPSDGKNIIDENTGELTLKTILIPVKNKNSYTAAMQYLNQILSFFPPVRPAVIGVHAGAAFPSIKRPHSKICQWLQTVRYEETQEAILQCAKIYNPDLIIIPDKTEMKLTRFLRRSLTERIAREAACPVLKSVYK